MKIIRSKGLFAMIGEEEKPHVFIDKSEEYRKCLEEIREILDKSCNQCKNEYLSEDYCSGQGDCFEIRQVINEVLNEE